DAGRYNDPSFIECQQSKSPSTASPWENDILELAMIESGIVDEGARQQSQSRYPHNAIGMTAEEIANIERSIRLDHDYAKSFY
ncbi:hypothetical protein AAVH_37354, partial [Aphelenchoides avenae]